MHIPDEADERPLAESMADKDTAEPFVDTWGAYKKTVNLDRVDTDSFRTGWPKPTIYREHEVIHVMANVIDQLLRIRDVKARMMAPDCDCGLAQRPRGAHHLTGCALIQWDRSFPPLFGGWTPTYEGDMCGGGHPGGQYYLNGRPACPRCGRYLDLRRCLCGEETHRSGLSRSFCQNRMRLDKRDAEDHPYLFQDEPEGRRPDA